MISTENEIAMPQPGYGAPALFRKVLILFTVTGVSGLGLFGVTIAGARAGNAAVIGFLTIVGSLAGLVITVACMAIASIRKATEKAPETS